MSEIFETDVPITTTITTMQFEGTLPGFIADKYTPEYRFKLNPKKEMWNKPIKSTGMNLFRWWMKPKENHE